MMLDHRNKTLFEDLTYIDSKTGAHLTQVDYDNVKEVMPTKRMIAMARAAEQKTIIAIHNHATNNFPSLADLHQAEWQKYGLIACHNGVVIKYEITGQINDVIVDQLIDIAHRIWYNKDGFDEAKWHKTIEQLQSENVFLEVFKQ